MASTRTGFAHLSRLAIRPACQLPTTSGALPLQQIRTAVTGTSQNAAKYKARQKALSGPVKRKKGRSTYELPDLSKARQFSLCDAMHYLQAFEAGQNPTSVKYELHIRLKTPKNGAMVRNRMRLPHPVKTDVRIAVICPPDSKAAEQAREAGAVLVGEEEVFEKIKEGKVEFDRCICHQDSLPKLGKANLGRILGPKGLMPSAKTGTVVKDVAGTVKDMVGGTQYRERLGVLRIAIGQLAFSPEEMAKNIKAFIGQIKKDMAQLSDQTPKSIHEVVLSTTHGPGLSLNSEFRSPNSVSPAELTAV